MYQDHPIEKNSDVDYLISLLRPHLELVDPAELYVTNQRIKNFAYNLKSDEVDFTARLILAIKKGWISREQYLKIILRRCLTAEPSRKELKRSRWQIDNRPRPLSPMEKIDRKIEQLETEIAQAGIKI